MTILQRFSLPIFILIIITSVVLAQAQQSSPALQSLVEAERSFAKTSVNKGQREAFLEYFAADGINFTPHPTNTREALRQRPPTPTSQPFILNWQPVFGDISAAGDLGFTTGPYTLVDNLPTKRPTGNGMYFSIWKKQADKTWQVVVDFGISTPQAVAPLTTTFTPAIHLKTTKSKVDPKSLLLIEEQYSQARKQFGWQQTFEKYFSSEARYYLPNAMPLIGKDAIRTYVGNSQAKVDYVPMKADLAVSGDLGYVYGSFDGRLEKGYYLRVWRRNKSGQFEIAAEIANFLPKEQKANLQPRSEAVGSIDGIYESLVVGQVFNLPTADG